MSDIVHIIRATIDPNSAPTREGQHWINTNNKKTWISVGTSLISDWQFVGDSDQVKTSANDTTAAFLSNKLIAGNGVALTTLNPNGNEIIEISAPGSTTDEKVKISANDTTPGYLESKLIAGSGISLTKEHSSLNEDILISSNITQYTDEMAQDTIANLIQNGTGISWAYNDLANILTPTISLSPFSTSNLSEGSNLYFTELRAQNAIFVTDSSSIDLTYASGNISAVAIPGGIDHNQLLNYNVNKHIDHSTVSLIAGTGIAATGLGDLTNSRTINLANTSVTASSYGSASQIPSFTVNAQGQLTAAANIPIQITESQVTNFNEAAQDAVGGMLTDTSSIDFTYNDAGNQITAVVLPAGVDHNQLLNYNVNKHIDHSSITIAAGTGLTGGGDLTSSRTISMPSIMTPGIYGDSSHFPIITLDAQGRVTSVSTTSAESHWSINTALDPGGLLTWSNETGQDLCIRQANNGIGSSYIRQVNSRGTLSSPLAIQNGDRIGGHGYYGWNPTGFNSLPSVAFNGYATENHTTSAQGGELRIENIPNGSTNPNTIATFQNNGDLSLTGSIIIGSGVQSDNGTLRYVNGELQIRQSDTWFVACQTPTYLSSTTSVSTTSSSFSIITGTTVTPIAGTYKVDFTAQGTSTNISSIGNFALYLDNTQQSTTFRSFSSLAGCISISSIVTVNGSQVLSIKFNRSSGTGSITCNQRELILTPISRA